MHTQPANTQSAKGIAQTILSAVIFGFAFTLAPFIYKGGFDVNLPNTATNALTLTFLRNALSLPFLLAIVLWLRIDLRLERKQLFSLALLAIVGNAITTLLLNMAFALIDVGIVTPIHFTYPIFVLLASVVFFKEKLSASKILATVVCTAGILVFFYEALLSKSLAGADFASALWGLVLAVVSGAFYAFYIIYLDKSGLKNEPPFKITFYVALCSSFAIAAYGTASDGLEFASMSTTSWALAALFALLCNVLALSLLQLGIKHVGATLAAIITTFEPITSVVCGALLLSEQITALKIIACALIFAGVLILSIKKS